MAWKRYVLVQTNPQTFMRLCFRFGVPVLGLHIDYSNSKLKQHHILRRWQHQSRLFFFFFFLFALDSLHTWHNVQKKKRNAKMHEVILTYVWSQMYTHCCSFQPTHGILKAHHNSKENRPPFVSKLSIILGSNLTCMWLWWASCQAKSCQHN